MRRGIKDFIEEENKSDLYIETITGGKISFYTHNTFESLRGNKFHYVYVDEFQDFVYPVDELLASLLPTLSDYQGQGYFFGTPKKYRPIYELHQMQGEIWGHYKMNAANNPRISPEEIKIQKDILPEKVYLQEWEGEFVDFNEEAWFYEYNSKVVEIDHYEIVDYEPILLSFDFNVDPGTCLMSQKVDKIGGHITVFKEIKVTGLTADLCKRVKYELELINHNGFVHVTGDSSGNDRSTNSNKTDYQTINEVLDIPYELFIDTRDQNPKLNHSRDMCNTVLHNDFIRIVRAECPILIKEMVMARPKPKDDSGNLVKDRKLNKMDSVDAFRYGINAYFKTIKDIRLYKEIVSS